MLTSLIRFHLKKLKREDQFQVKSNAKEIMSSKIERESLKEKRQRQRDKYRETDTEREKEGHKYSVLEQNWGHHLNFIRLLKDNLGILGTT